MSKDSIITTEGVTVSFGDFQALKGIDVKIKQGEIMIILGPSGSGKSTFIRTLNRLQPHDGGRVIVDGIELNEDTTVADLKHVRSEIGFVFQQFNLFPHLTVLENVALGPQKVKGMAKGEAEKRADDWLGRLGLGRFGDRYPRQLSGGQRKRVAIAQVLALAPRLLLMDEPFASLDAIVRARLTEELLEWVEKEQLTVLLVTHDLEEAIGVSDVVYVLSHGPRASVRARHEVAIDRPRHMIEVRQHAVFGTLMEALWAQLAEEPVASDGAGTL